MYDPATDSWTATSNAGAPDARSAHGVVWTGQKMIIWGGQSAAGLLNGGALFDPTTNAWKGPMSTVNAPSTRSAPGMVWTGNRLIVWGGFSGYNWDLNTGGQWVSLSLYQKN